MRIGERTQKICSGLPQHALIESRIMTIILNNSEKQFDDDQLSVRQLLERMSFTFPMIVVKVNGKLIKKESYDKVFVRHGDKVEALHLISGG